MVIGAKVIDAKVIDASREDRFYTEPLKPLRNAISQDEL